MTDDAKQEREAVLLPCPNVLCGSENSMVWHTDTRKSKVEWSVMCRDCGAALPQKCFSQTEAIAAWNTRAQTDATIEAQAAEIERISSQRDAYRDGYKKAFADVVKLHDALERIEVATRNEVRAGDKGYVSRYGINGITRAALEQSK